MKVSWKWKIKIIHNVRNFLTHIQREWEKERGRESSPSGMCDLWPVTDEWLRNSSSLEHDSDSWEDMTCKKKSFGLKHVSFLCILFVHIYFMFSFLSKDAEEDKPLWNGRPDDHEVPEPCWYPCGCVGDWSEVHCSPPTVLSVYLHTLSSSAGTYPPVWKQQNT